MSTFYELVSTTLADRKIDDADVALVRETLYQNGKLDLDDVKLLVELYCGASQRSAAFDELFFSVLEHVLLDDGEIQPSEQYYLLKMLYSHREVRQPEREFLGRLHAKAASRSPEFDALCEAALRGRNVD